MKIRPCSLSQRDLQDALHYDPETGVFTWKNDRQNHAKAGSVAGCANTSGYWCIGIGKENWPAHRLAWLYVHGRWPTDQIDHINRNPLDNRIANLREVSASENRQNIPAYRTNKSGYKGVHRFKANGKWQAQIRHERRRYHLGFYENVEDAAAAYAKAAAHLHKFNTVLSERP